ncbi:hypothetical protein [Paenibacillus sp. FSL K6-2393]|uniref:hypothetical protein n=1 Tax=Paenibacillus sp. FSL K6-2393 TaxID=2921475 RepID=UPI0030F91715
MKATIDTQEQLLVWHRTALSIMDIRHIIIVAGGQHSPYSFPASAFLYDADIKWQLFLIHDNKKNKKNRDEHLSTTVE